MSSLRGASHGVAEATIGCGDSRLSPRVSTSGSLFFRTWCCRFSRSAMTSPAKTSYNPEATATAREWLNAEFGRESRRTHTVYVHVCVCALCRSLVRSRFFASVNPLEERSDFVKYPPRRFNTLRDGGSSSCSRLSRNKMNVKIINGI